MYNVPPVVTFQTSGLGKRGRGRRRGRGRGRGQGGRWGRWGGEQQAHSQASAGTSVKIVELYSRKGLFPRCMLSVECKVCSRTWHLCCVRNRTGGGTKFIGHECSQTQDQDGSPDPSSAPPRVPAPALASASAPAPTPASAQTSVPAAPTPLRPGSISVQYGLEQSLTLLYHRSS